MTVPLLDLGALWAEIAAKGGGGGNAETLKRYWTEGEGAAKIRWGEGGDYDRCVRLLEEETKGAGLDVHGYCANLHHRALGIWPATHKKELKGAGWEAAKHAHAAGPHGYVHGWIKVGSPAHDDLERGLNHPAAVRVRDHLDKAHAAHTAGDHATAEDHLIDAKNVATYGGTAPALKRTIREALAQVQEAKRNARRQAHAAAGDGLQVPALVTLPGVDIVAAGRWKLASGEQTFTPADLRHAVHASQCPAVGAPVIKVGHVDPRFDGEPAVGRVLNMAVTAEGNKITGDLAGMPGWLGAVAASAYPRRSIEGTYDFQCQIGHVHPFVITGLALLGVTPPGVGVLGGLRDVAGLYGVQAAAQSGATWRLDAGGDMPAEVTARAVTEMDVRRAYYESPGVAMSLWITELQMDPAQLIVADEATSKVYRVPFHIEAGAITFGDAAEVSVSYADVAAARGAGMAMVYASAEESRDVGAATGTLADDAHGTTPGSEAEDAGDCTECGGSGKVDGGTCPHCKGSGREPMSASAGDPAGDDAPGGGDDGPASVSPAPGVTASWDGSGAVAALGTDPSAGQIRAMFALPGATKSDSSLPHHNVSGGQVGAANPDGCSAAIAAINGARGGLKGQGPDKLRSAYNHLAAHLRAAGRTPPPFKAAAEDHPAGIKVDAAGRHGTFSGTHSHPHAALGSQAGDQTHDHSHTHKGDGRHAHVHAAGTEQGGQVDFTDDQMAALRSAFGLGEDEELTPDQLVQAAGALRERADSKQVAASRPLPPGVITVEQEAWDALHNRVRAGEEYRAAQLRGERDQVIAAAVTAGKFSTAQMERWRRLWDRDPDGTREVLASLAPNVVPVEDIGGPGGVEEMDGDYARLFSKDYVASTRRPGA